MFHDCRLILLQADRRLLAADCPSGLICNTLSPGGWLGMGLCGRGDNPEPGLCCGACLPALSCHHVSPSTFPPQSLHRTAVLRLASGSAPPPTPVQSSFSCPCDMSGVRFSEGES